ncbi:MAG: RES domain-containing protein [Paraburkholderia tropica]
MRYLENTNQIKRLRSLSEKLASPSDFTPLLNRIMYGVMLHAITSGNQLIYRGRFNERGRLFHSVNEVSYPKPEFVKQKGRLNDIGQSVLYAAESELGVIIELAAHINCVFTLSKIERRQESTLFFFPIGISQFDRQQEKTVKADSIVVDYLRSEITKHVAHSDEYNATIAIGDMLLRKTVHNSPNQKYTGAIYPSVKSRIASNTTTYNFAMEPHVFDENYRITESTVYILTNEKTNYQINPINKGDVQATGEINWKFSFDEMKRRVSDGLWFDDYVNPSITACAESL